jgi:hypothetical protein
MKKVEASIMKEYKPRMKKLTYSQGKLLIKLVYRECSSSSYDLIRGFLGPIRAGFYQTFAWFFGPASRKTTTPTASTASPSAWCCRWRLESCRLP